jgi:hypothetical protein
VFEMLSFLSMLLGFADASAQQLDSGIGNLGSAVSDTTLTLSLQVMGLGS